jgi:hypothetical protein
MIFRGHEIAADVGLRSTIAKCSKELLKSCAGWLLTAAKTLREGAKMALPRQRQPSGTNTCSVSSSISGLEDWSSISFSVD